MITKEMEVNAVLLNKLIELRNLKNSSNLKKDKILYDKYFEEVYNKFSYIVDMHTFKYKKYPNYKDLKQEGSLGLFIALSRFDPQKSKNFFKLANWYVKTRIKRAANKHDVIRLPLSKSKNNNHLNRVQEMPIIIDNSKNPYERLENTCINDNIKNAVSTLPYMQKKVISMYFGLDEYSKCKKMTINKISHNTSLPKIEVYELLKSAYESLSKILESFKI